VTETAERVPGTRPAGPAHATRRRRSGALEWVAVILVALIGALLLHAFVVTAYFIPSGSMEPTIKPGDRVLVDRLSYDLHGVHAGDVVVFAKPADDDDPGVRDLIKRVIGLPGERIRSGPGGEILVGGRPLRQPWLTRSAEAHPGPPICSINRTDCIGSTLVLPAGEYYMMGDNRGDSEDSRYFGPVSRSLIVGRAFVRIWPLSRLHWF